MGVLLYAYSFLNNECGGQRPSLLPLEPAYGRKTLQMRGNLPSRPIPRGRYQARAGGRDWPEMMSATPGKAARTDAVGRLQLQPTLHPGGPVRVLLHPVPRQPPPLHITGRGRSLWPNGWTILETENNRSRAAAQDGQKAKGNGNLSLPERRKTEEIIFARKKKEKRSARLFDCRRNFFKTWTATFTTSAAIFNLLHRQGSTPHHLEALLTP